MAAFAFLRFRDLPAIAITLTASVPIVALVMTRHSTFVLKALTAETSPRDAGRAAFLIAMIVVAGVLFWLEYTEPFYFAQDDNLVILPVTIAGAQSLFHGIFPTFNPYQFLGQPTSVQSIYALTYPFTYAVYGIAHLVDNDDAFVDVFAIFHLLAACAATYWASRETRVRAPLAAAAAIAVCLAGATLIISRSWVQMSPVVLWMPLLIGLTERFRRRRGSFLWAMATGCTIALFCHSGNGQMWVYGMMFTAIVFVFLAMAGEITRRGFAWLTVALLIGIALSLPLIIPQMWFMRGVAREGGAGTGIEYALRAMFLPMPLVHAPHPSGWGRTEVMASFYYDGTVFAIVAIAAILTFFAIIFACRWRAPDVKRIVSANVWLVCAFGALILAFGEHGGVWDLMSSMPVFHMFTEPWKLIMFFNIFAAIGGAAVLERILSDRAALIVAIAVAMLVVCNANMARTAFYNYGFKPYPSLPASMTSLRSGRILVRAPERDPSPDYALSLAHNLPTRYSISSAEGYDPFMKASVENATVAERLQHDPGVYGVRWIITYDAGGTHVNEVTGAAPLAFSADDPARELPIVLSQRGVDVDPRGARRIVLNFLARPGIVIAGSSHTERDAWGRIVADVLPERRTIALRYDGPWRTALIMSLITLLAALAVALNARRIA